MDARRFALRYGLTLLGCAVGAFGIVYVLGAVVLDRFINPTR